MTGQNESRAIIEKFVSENPDIERIELLFPDMNGIFRGKWLPRESAGKLATGGVRLPISTYALDIWGRDVDATGLAIAKGDPDGIGVPIIETLKRISWTDQPAAQILMSLETVDGKPCIYDPRQQLASVVARFTALGLTPVIAPELEFYLFKATEGEGMPPVPVRKNETGSQLYDLKEMAHFELVLNDIRNACTELDIPADTIIAEYGPGQFEINFRHVADALRAADNAILFKRLVWGCAKKHGLAATFMAKPYGDQSGNGMHVHISLLDDKGANIFSDTNGPNDALRHATGGLIATMRKLQAVFTPNMNSFRRLQPKSFAPVAANWGLDNRAATIRVPQIEGPGARLEHRLCGADVNPYLAISAILGGILIGLENRIDPGPPLKTDEVAGEPLHHDWMSTVDDFASSEAAEKIFGPDYRRVYAACRHAEIAEMTQKVTDVEYRTYLSRL